MESSTVTVSAWRNIPVSKQLVAPIYKPFRPVGGEQPQLGNLQSPWLLTNYKSWDDPPAMTLSSSLVPKNPTWVVTPFDKDTDELQSYLIFLTDIPTSKVQSCAAVASSGKKMDLVVDQAVWFDRAHASNFVHRCGHLPFAWLVRRRHGPVNPLPSKLKNKFRGPLGHDWEKRRSSNRVAGFLQVRLLVWPGMSCLSSVA